MTPPSQESLSHAEGESEHGLVQSNGGDSSPAEHAAVDPRSAAQSRDSSTPLGHMIARPSSQVAEASGAQVDASLPGLHASHCAASAEGNPPHLPAPLVVQSMPRSTPG